MKLVFADYELSFPTYGSSVGGWNFARDIAEASALWIDGFSVNLGSWSVQPYYQDRAAQMFAAAVGTNFKLFFSVDMSGDLSATDIVALMQQYAGHPNYFNDPTTGRPVLTTFLGQDNGQDFWQNQVLGTLRSAGINPFFVPRFVPGVPVTTANLSANWHSWWSTVADGLTFWPSDIAWESPQPTDCAAEIVSWGQTYASFLKGVGARFVGTLLPTFWVGRIVPGLPRFYEELHGAEGIVTQVNSLVAQNPDWAIIITWNDFTESYVTPAPIADISAETKGAYNIGPLLLSHAGYAQFLGDYCIPWFKNGAPPAITRDAMYYFYRTHSKSLVAPNDTQNISLVGNPLDNLYVTTLLTTPAKLRVHSGTAVWQFNLGAGINHTRIPFQARGQTFQLDRNSQVVAFLSGDNIASSISLYDFFGTSGHN